MKSWEQFFPSANASLGCVKPLRSRVLMRESWLPLLKEIIYATVNYLGEVGGAWETKNRNQHSTAQKCWERKQNRA